MLSFFQLILTTGLLAALLNSSTWKALEFEGVVSNEVIYEEGAMIIKVSDSGSPLVSVFPAPVEIKEITVRGTVSGTLDLTPEAIWTKNTDDALLRLGLIEPGEKKLSTIQRFAAPTWVKTLEKMFAGKMEGIEKIRCFHLMPDAALIGKYRINPTTDIFVEQIQAAPDADGSFVLSVSFPEEPLMVAGLWLMADGDDTDSIFNVTITDLDISE